MNINLRRRPVTACNILNLRIFRPESAKHNGAKKFIQIECIQTDATADLISEIAIYVLVTPNIKLFLCTRYMHDCVYVYRATDRACSPGRLSGIFGKSGKNYRLRTTRRTVQTPAGNLDKWRSNDSRPADLLAEWARSRPSPRRDKKKFHDQTAERGAIDMHQYFPANWFFFLF